MALEPETIRALIEASEKLRSASWHVKDAAETPDPDDAHEACARALRYVSAAAGLIDSILAKGR